MKVKLYLSNYATKSYLKNAAGSDTSKFAKTVDLVSLKSDVGKLDINKLKNVPSNLNNLKIKVDKIDVDKLVAVPADLSKLIDVVKSDIVKKDLHKIRQRILTLKYLISLTQLIATNTTLNAKINEFKNEIPSISELATATAINVKTNEVKSKILSITNLTTSATLTTVENKIPNFSNLVKEN